MNAEKINNNQNYAVFIKCYQNLHTFEKQKGISNWNQSRLVIVNSKTEFCLTIRTLTCWERIQAFFGFGVASLSNIRNVTHLNNVESLVKSDKLSTYNILSVAKAAFISKNLVSAKIVQQELKSIARNARDNNGATALISAASRENADVVKMLIEAGADVNAKDNNGATALINAAIQKDMDAMQILVGAGADVNIKDADGNTALILALSFKDEFIDLDIVQPLSNTVQLLIDAGADVHIKNNEGKTASDCGLGSYVRNSGR